MGGAKGVAASLGLGLLLEKVSRAAKTVIFVAAMLASLVLLSAPLLVAVGDVAASVAIAARLTCFLGCHSPRDLVANYNFRTSLQDIPVVSVARSIVITCVYSFSEGPGLVSGPYLGTATFCCFASLLILFVKACLFTPTLDITDGVVASAIEREKMHMQKSWGMPVLFLSSLVFALGHVVIAYRTTCRARRKLLLCRLDPEAILACKTMFSGYQKVPRSPTPNFGRSSKSDCETKRKALLQGGQDLLPISLLADVDSLFVACRSIIVHYKVSPLDSCSLSSSHYSDVSSFGPTPTIISQNIRFNRAPFITQKIHLTSNRSFSVQNYSMSSLCDPLLVSETLVSSEVPKLSLDESILPSSVDIDVDLEVTGKFGVVLVHGFGGGVFSWRHIMGTLSRQIGHTVVAFDRPGWGLTSRPRRKDWEKKKLLNPYTLESQVDLLLSFCKELHFSSIVLVGHDDGGLLALKAVEKVLSSASPHHIVVRGVVLLNASLSREVVPGFARILLHTSLRKKHMIRPLLRTEVTQVVNRRAWYDATKLTSDVLNLYKAPLYAEGWDEALHEIGRLSFATVLSIQNADNLLKSVQDIPVLVVAGAEDALVSLKSAQAMASKLSNSRLVAISGCGHLPHEECPKALLAALSPFISKLLSSADSSSQSQRQ